jgi:uncharacterized paraquat-inducible protein A
MHRWINLSLLVLFPLSWFAPLLRAGLLPLFGLSEISVMTGLQSLWASDVFLALVVTVFALFAPYLKTIGLALLHWNLLSARCLPALHVLGKLAMADVFLIALYITLTKGIGVGRIEVAWGLYLFTACIFASLWVGLRTKQSDQDADIVSKSATHAADLPHHSPDKIR